MVHPAVEQPLVAGAGRSLPKSSDTGDLAQIALAMGIAFYFTLSIWRRKFLWFLGDAKTVT